MHKNCSGKRFENGVVYAVLASELFQWIISVSFSVLFHLVVLECYNCSCSQGFHFLCCVMNNYYYLSVFLDVVGRGHIWGVNTRDSKHQRVDTWMNSVNTIVTLCFSQVWLQPLSVSVLYFFFNLVNCGTFLEWDAFDKSDVEKGT